MLGIAPLKTHTLSVLMLRFFHRLMTVTIIINIHCYMHAFLIYSGYCSNLIFALRAHYYYSHAYHCTKYELLYNFINVLFFKSILCKMPLFHKNINKC